MSASLTGKHLNRDRDTIGTQVQDAIENQWGEMTGTVVSFDPATQTATVRPDYMRPLAGVPTPIPDLQEVPVRFPRAGGFIITTPVRPGDKIALRPQMRNSESFHQGDGYTAPDARTNSLSDYEAFLDGGEPLSNPIPNFNNNAMEMRSADGANRMRFSEDGKFEITGAQGDWYDIITQVVELLATDDLTITSGSPNPHGHELRHRAQYNALAEKLRAMTGAPGP